MQSADYFLSVVVPVFNEELVIDECVNRLMAVMTTLGCKYELVFVDDGSQDSTLKVLKEKRLSNPNIKIISFTRNFGHQVAITAGLDYAKGDATVTLDGDLQDPPEVIPEMVARWREGNEVVYARRKSRTGETLFKMWTASAYYRVLRAVTHVDIPVDTGDFRLMSRHAIAALAQVRERHRYLRGLVAWIGFKQAFVEYNREPRFAGRSNYSLAQSVRLSIYGITSFSALPLRIATACGATIMAIGLILAIVLVVMILSMSQKPDGWLVTIDVVLIMSGLQLLCLGFASEYISILNVEVKHRPLYFIGEMYD